jgi:hypothetical protein
LGFKIGKPVSPVDYLGVAVEKRIAMDVALILDFKAVIIVRCGVFERIRYGSRFIVGTSGKGQIGIARAGEINTVDVVTGCA